MLSRAAFCLLFGSASSRPSSACSGKQRFKKATHLHSTPLQQRPMRDQRARSGSITGPGEANKYLPEATFTVKSTKSCQVMNRVLQNIKESKNCTGSSWAALFIFVFLPIKPQAGMTTTLLVTSRSSSLSKAMLVLLYASLHCPSQCQKRMDMMDSYW